MTYPIPTEPGIVRITPDMARDWLDTRNHGNRNLSAQTAQRYAQAIREGRWLTTHQNAHATGRTVGVLRVRDGEKTPTAVQ